MSLFKRYEPQYIRLGSRPDVKGVPVPLEVTCSTSPLGPDDFGLELLSDLSVQTNLLNTIEMAKREGEAFDLIGPTYEDVELVVRETLAEMGPDAVVIGSPTTWTIMRTAGMMDSIKDQGQEADGSRPALFGHTIPIDDEPRHAVFVNDMWDAKEPIMVCGSGWFRHVYQKGVHLEVTPAGTYVRNDIQIECDLSRVRVISSDYSKVRFF